MAKPNAQNSELDPKIHPSGARIEKIVNGESSTNTKADRNGEKGLYGETLRPSEREDSYMPTADKAEGERSETSDDNNDNHRRSPSTRNQ